MKKRIYRITIITYIDSTTTAYKEFLKIGVHKEKNIIH